MVVIFVLGEQAGRDGPSRSSKLQEIVTKKTELKNLQSQLSPTPIVNMLIAGVIIFVLMNFLGFWNDDDDYHRRRR
jgi:hypothetical protein